MNNEDGLVTYYGKRNTIISYVASEHKWLMYLVNDDNTTAESTASLQTLAMGNNRWRISKDFDCSLQDTEATLSLTTCGSDQYTCDNGLCVDILKRCNSRPDCSDKSDELNCRKINVGEAYQKYISPPAQENDDKVVVKVSADLISIIDIDEIASIFQVQFTLHFSWFDSRLTFDNLKNDTGLNALSPREKDTIWIPELVFTNTEFRPSTIVDEDTAITVEKRGGFVLSPSTSFENMQVYSGGENPLILSRFYNIRFLCTYDMRRIPFDIQKCRMILTMKVII